MGAYGKMAYAVPGMIADITDREVATYEIMEDIAFGAPVFSYIGDVKKAYNYKLDTVKVVYSRDFEASNSIAFSVNGVSITPVVYSASHGATEDALVAAVNALTGVDVFDDTSDTNNRTFYVRTKGYACTVVTTVTLGSNQATATLTSSSDQVFVGVAQFVQKSTSVGYEFDNKEPLTLFQRGKIWVTAGATVYSNDNILITTAGAYGNTGYDINARYDSNATSALVVIRVNGKYKANAEIAWA